jgi:AcrR family transcriptional regulator
MLCVMMTAQDRKRQEREARRHRIQDAARPVFFDRGFARASIEDIAKQAQLSVGAIYLYFKSKEDLYLSILERSLARLGDRLEAADDPRVAWEALAAWRAAEPESAPGAGDGLAPGAASGPDPGGRGRPGGGDPPGALGPDRRGRPGGRRPDLRRPATPGRSARPCGRCSSAPARSTPPPATSAARRRTRPSCSR